MKRLPTIDITGNQIAVGRVPGMVIGRKIGPSFVGALDAFTTDLAGAWSVVRRLLTDYTGPLGRARRSSDSTELDIGYNADGSLDTAALLAFAGAGDAFWRYIYDQSGAGIDLDQGMGAHQAKCVASGSLLTNAGQPVMQFIPASGTYMTSDAAVATQYMCISGRLISNVSYAGLITADASSLFIISDATGATRYNYGTADYYVDAVNQSGTQAPLGYATHVFSHLTGSPLSLPIRIGIDWDFFGGYWDGPVHECVIYGAPPADRSIIETALMTPLGL